MGQFVEPGKEQALHSDFLRALLYLEENAQKSRLPWFNSFPKNSCEPSSSYLAKTLEKRHPALKVSIVRGSAQKKGDHFWVEADGYVMDITIDPFDECRPPIFKLAPHPSHEFFDNVEHMNSETAWVRLESGCLEFLGLLLKDLETLDTLKIDAVQGGR
jgi:hypothetical protein